jgi:hypothetical protein
MKIFLTDAMEGIAASHPEELADGSPAAEDPGLFRSDMEPSESERSITDLAPWDSSANTQQREELF